MEELQKGDVLENRLTQHLPPPPLAGNLDDQENPESLENPDDDRAIISRSSLWISQHHHRAHPRVMNYDIYWHRCR